MRELTLATVLGGILTGALVGTGNLIFQTQILGISLTSDIIIGAFYGGVLAIGMTVASILVGFHRSACFLVGGPVVAGALYGFSALFGIIFWSPALLAVYAIIGFTAGLGSLISCAWYALGKRLQNLT